MRRSRILLFLLVLIPSFAVCRQVALNLESVDFFENEHIRLSVTVLSNNGQRDNMYNGFVRLSGDDLLMQLRGRNPDGSYLDGSLPDVVQVRHGINTNLMIFSSSGGTFKLKAMLDDDPGITGAVTYTSKACRERILLSEVMYRSTYSNLSYIEIYNNSDDVVDLKGCEVRQYKSYNSWISSRLSYVSNSLMLLQKEYLLLTLKFDELIKIFPASTGVKKVDALTEPLDGSCTMILYLDGKAEDSLEYSYDWTTEKHSLERCTFGLNPPLHDHWQESLSGPSVLLGHYGTPGWENGNFVPVFDGRDAAQPEMTITGNVITKKNRWVECSFLPAGPGRAAAELCTSSGSKIRILFPEQDVPQGERRDISFEATDHAGKVLKPGIYFVVLRIISEDTGSYKKIIKPVVVGW